MAFLRQNKVFEKLRGRAIPFKGGPAPRNSMVTSSRPAPSSLLGGTTNGLPIASQTANATKASYPR